jgi:hypothetical protein
LILLLSGCINYDIPTTLSVTITVRYPAEINEGGYISDAEVLARNIQTGREFTEKTDKTGKVQFNLRGGVYDIIVSFSENEAIEIQGTPTVKTIIINGSLTNQKILIDNIQLNLTTEYSILKNSFIIKELYTSASRTPEGKNYNADKFVEIYNNSNQVLFSDGLCFGIVRHRRTYTPNPWVDSAGKMLPRIPVWSYVAIVPGTGKEHPIQPGESFVIALSAINHKDNPNGNPNSIDLSEATWEMCVEDGKYIDNPSVPNIFMQQIHENPYAHSIAISVWGQVSILFRLPSKNLNTVFSNPDNYLTEPLGNEPCFMVPFDWVIDGVENPELNSSVFKRLPDCVDVGFIQHQGSGERVSIKRKVKEVINERTIYEDTNNSTNDFLTNQKPTPGVIAKN